MDVGYVFGAIQDSLGRDKPNGITLIHDRFPVHAYRCRSCCHVDYFVVLDRF